MIGWTRLKRATAMQILPLTLADRDPWADLLARAFERSPAEMAAILDHLHATFPLLAWGAWDGDRLVAQYSSLLTELHIPGAAAPALVGVCINMATHPAYRGLGLIKQVARPVYEELVARGGVAGVGFSNAAGVRVDQRSRSYGYQVVGKMQPHMALLARAPQIPPLDLVETWPEHLVLSSHETIHFAPTPAWLRYRFNGHPQRAYQFAAWSQHGECNGVIGYRLRRERYGTVAALLAAYGANPAELIARWARTLWEAGIHFVQVLATPGTPWISALRRVALVVPLPWTRQPYYLTVKPLGTAEPPSLLDFAAWDCLGGDIL